MINHYIPLLSPLIYYNYIHLYPWLSIIKSTNIYLWFVGPGPRRNIEFWNNRSRPDPRWPRLVPWWFRALIRSAWYQDVPGTIRGSTWFNSHFGRFWRCSTDKMIKQHMNFIGTNQMFNSHFGRFWRFLASMGRSEGQRHHIDPILCPIWSFPFQQSNGQKHLRFGQKSWELTPSVQSYHLPIKDRGGKFLATPHHLSEVTRGPKGRWPVRCLG